jgi:Winged helix DNA-binding domain
MTVLSQAALGRATLARQMLLEPAECDPVEAIAHLVGLQAQAQFPPYYGLWCRLREFAPERLAELILDRTVVRVALMRSTVHLATATDARILRPVLQPALTRMFTTTVSGRTLAAAGIEHADLARAGRDVLSDEPLTFKELGERLHKQWPDTTCSVLADGVRTAIPLVQVPPRGVWGAGGALRLATLDDWAPGPDGRPDDPDGGDDDDNGGRRGASRAVETMIVRYLGAFGPASVADIQAWCGLTRLSEIVDRLRGELVSFRCESGVEVVDLPRAPRPDPAIPAPVRLIAEFDNLTLSHADRSRVISDVDRRRAFSRNGIVPGFVLVNGVVQAIWRLMPARTGATLRIEELRAMARGQRAEVEAEGRRMLAFAVPSAVHDVEFRPAA